MKKLLIRFSLILAVFLNGLCISAASAQSTIVTMTVTDSSGQIWANGTVAYQFRGNGSYNGQYQWNGSILSSNYLTPTIVNLDNTGSATVTVPTSSAIAPANSTWSYTVCPNASTQCQTYNIAAVGTTQNISSQITPSAFTIPISTIPLAYSDSQIKTIPAQGGIYYNTLNAIGPRYYDGTTFHPFGGSSGSGYVQIAPSSSQSIAQPASTYFGVTSAGVFTTPTVYQAYDQTNINNGNPFSVYAAFYQLPNIDAKSAAILVPSTSTYHQADAVAGYIDNFAAATSAVALGGYGRNNVIGGQVWGINAAAIDKGVSITSITTNGTVATITYSTTCYGSSSTNVVPCFLAGEQGIFAGLTGANVTAMNSNNVSPVYFTVLSAGLTTTTFEVAYTGTAATYEESNAGFGMPFGVSYAGEFDIQPSMPPSAYGANSVSLGLWIPFYPPYGETGTWPGTYIGCVSGIINASLTTCLHSYAGSTPIGVVLDTAAATGTSASQDIEQNSNDSTKVGGITVIAGGSGYSAPTVSFSGGGCSTEPTGIATATSGAVTAVTLATHGVGCSTAPTVAFAGGTGATATAFLGVGHQAHHNVDAAGVIHINTTGNDPILLDGITDAGGFAPPTQDIVSNMTLSTRSHVVLLNANSGGFTLTLPATPTTVTGGLLYGNQNYIACRQDSTANAITISGNGNNIQGVPSYSSSLTYTLPRAQGCYEISWDNLNTVWNVLGSPALNYNPASVAITGGSISGTTINGATITGTGLPTGCAQLPCLTGAISQTTFTGTGSSTPVTLATISVAGGEYLACLDVQTTTGASAAPNSYAFITYTRNGNSANIAAQLVQTTNGIANYCNSISPDNGNAVQFLIYQNPATTGTPTYVYSATLTRTN